MLDLGEGDMVPVEQLTHFGHHRIRHFASLEHGGMPLFQQFVAGACGTDFATIHDGHAVAEIFDIGQQVRAEQHCLSAPGEGRDQILDLSRADGVHTAGRFVENQQLRVIDQALCESDASLHALGILPHGAVLHRLQSDHVEQHIDAVPSSSTVQAEEPAVVIERFSAAQKSIEIRLLRQVADEPLRCDVARPLAENRDPTCRRP